VATLGQTQAAIMPSSSSSKVSESASEDVSSDAKRRLRKALKLLSVVKEKYKFEREVSTELAKRNESLKCEVELEKVRFDALMSCYAEMEEIAFSCIDTDMLPNTAHLREKQRAIQDRVALLKPPDAIKPVGRIRCSTEICLNIPEMLGTSLTRRMSGNFLLIYIYNIDVLNHVLLFYIYKLRWNLNTMFVGVGRGNSQLSVGSFSSDQSSPLFDAGGVYICKSIVNYLRHGNYICKRHCRPQFVFHGSWFSIVKSK
jgi:hypothetical protein